MVTIRSALCALAFAAASALSAPAHGQGAEAANRLLVTSMQAWNEAQALQSPRIETVLRRAELLEEVHLGLQAIVDQHPGSDHAVRLMTGEQIGPLSIDGARNAAFLARTAYEVAACRQEGSVLRRCILVGLIQIMHGHLVNRPSPIEYMRVVRIAREGDREGTLFLLQFVDDPVWRARIRASLAQAFAESGQVSEAYEILDAIDDPQSMAAAYLGIALASRDPEALEHALRHIQASEPAFLRDRDYARIVAAHAELVSVPRAMELIETMDSESARIDARIMLGRAQQDTNLLLQVLRDFLDGVDSSARQRGDLAEALVLFRFTNEANQLVVRETDQRDRGELNRRILIARAQSGHVHLALVANRQLNDEILRTRNLTDIAILSHRAPLLQEALDSVELLEDEGLKAFLSFRLGLSMGDYNIMRSSLYTLLPDGQRPIHSHWLLELLDYYDAG